MNTTIKTVFIAVLVLSVSCKKENSRPGSAATDNAVSEIISGKYSAVRIGTQVWMAKNLDVTRYRNGDKIPQVWRKTDWRTLTTGAWSWQNNDSVKGVVYGKLYNWYAVNDPRGLAPAGWHIPTNAEWDTLMTYLGKNAAGKLKDTGTIEDGTGLWYQPNDGATNKSGFTALPGGHRNWMDGKFFELGYYGYWWSSTREEDTLAWYRALSYKTTDIFKWPAPQQNGMSVRCIKD